MRPQRSGARKKTGQTSLDIRMLRLIIMVDSLLCVCSKYPRSHPESTPNHLINCGFSLGFLASEGEGITL